MSIRQGITRRGVLAGSGLLLARPGFSQEAVDGGIVLTAEIRDAALVPDGGKAKVWSYGGWPQPVLRAKQGQPFHLRIENKLQAGLTLHWFGVRGPSDMMSLAVAPGEAFDCAFTPPDAGTFWFGPVSDASRQRELGLCGMLIVEEADGGPGAVDVPLVFDDWRLDETGGVDEQSFGNLEDAIAEGRMGNWFTINGGYKSHVPVPKDGWARLRCLNVANMRTMAVQFKGDAPLVIARDGQPVAPVWLGDQPLFLAPGQRADLLAGFGSKSVPIALDLFEDVVETGYLDPTGEGGKITVEETFALPANPLPALGDLAAARVVPLTLEGGAKGGLKSATLGGERLELRALLEQGYAWAMDGVAGLGGAPWQVFARGETIVLDIKNETRFEQVLCVHGHVWRPEEGGDFADTAVIGPRASRKLAFVADNPGVWGLQSTMAERADAGLITTFEVSDPA